MVRTRGRDESLDGGQGSGPSCLVWITLVWSVLIQQAPWSHQVESIVRASAESEASAIDWFSDHRSSTSVSGKEGI